MKTGQRVVCIKSTTRERYGRKMPNTLPEKGRIYTITDLRNDPNNGDLFLKLEGMPTNCCFNANGFIPLDENWTEEVIANVLKKQLTEPVNNGLHFSQIIG